MSQTILLLLADVQQSHKLVARSDGSAVIVEATQDGAAATLEVTKHTGYGVGGVVLARSPSLHLAAALAATAFPPL